jgi:putative sterol carrier protein
MHDWPRLSGIHKDDAPMTDATTDFFNALARQGREPLLTKVTGTIRFDLQRDKHTDHIFVTIRKGKVTISDANNTADCIIRADRELFDSITSGRANAMASALRGTLLFEGNSHMLVSFQRLFPGPSDQKERIDAGRGQL